MPPRCEIDADLLIEALTRPLDGEAHLDPDSGEVFLGDVFDEEDEERESERDDLITITRVETGDEYARMVEFAEGVSEDDVREQLMLALDGRGAFGRFRTVLARYPDLAAEWERQRRAWLLEEARAWLEALGIDAVLVRNTPEPPPAPSPAPKAALRIGLLDLLLLGAPEGRTELLEGQVYRVFDAATPEEARRVFKNAARDLCEFHGTAWRNRYIEGRDDYAIDRAQLRVAGRHIELAIAVTPELWRRFGG